MCLMTTGLSIKLLNYKVASTWWIDGEDDAGFGKQAFSAVMIVWL